MAENPQHHMPGHAKAMVQITRRQGQKQVFGREVVSVRAGSFQDSSMLPATSHLPFRVQVSLPEKGRRHSMARWLCDEASVVTRRCTASSWRCGTGLAFAAA